MFLLLAATASAWWCPTPPPADVRQSRVLRTMGTPGSVDAGAVADIVDGPWWARDLLNWRRDVRAIRVGTVTALHVDDRAWLETFVARTPRPRGTADVEACVAERGLGPVRATFDARDAALGRWFAAEAIRAGAQRDAILWFEAVDLDRAAVVARFVAGDAEALLELGDTDAFLERADVSALAGWVAEHPLHRRAPEARTLLDAALAEAGRWEEVRNPTLARTGLRLRAWEAGPTGGPWYLPLVAAVGEHPTFAEAAQLAWHAGALGERAEEWRWTERAFALAPRGEAGAVETYMLALGTVASDYARGGLDAVLAVPPAGVREEATLRAELATLTVEGDAPVRARSAIRTLWLAHELARVADDEDARAEGLYRLGKALLDVNDAFSDWPRPTDPSADSYTPTRDESPLERLGRAILADTLARATRLYAWNVWVVRAEALLARNWPAEWAVRAETRGAASGWEMAGPAASGHPSARPWRPWRP